MEPGLKKVISGGESGVGRAALDSAISRLIYSWGGWVPKGRLAESGEIPDSYFEPQRVGCGLRECERGRPFTAKVRNIREADATLILRPSRIGGTLPDSLKTVIQTCRRNDKPYRIFDPYKTWKVPAAVRWICETNVKEGTDEQHEIQTLNVVGIKESKHPGIYDRTLIYMNDVLGFVSTYQIWGIKIWAPKRKPKAK